MIYCDEIYLKCVFIHMNIIFYIIISGKPKRYLKDCFYMVKLIQKKEKSMEIEKKEKKTYGGDSGFNELSDESKSTSISPDATNLITTPSRIDSTSDDTGCLIDTADEKDEVSSTVSNLSDLSGLSDFSGEGDINHQWRNASSWVQKQMLIGADPRNLLHHLLMDSTQIPEQVDDLTLWKIIINMMSEPPRRQKLRHINTLTDVVRLIRNSNRIIVLTGAGVSVSCGIPDFRSRDGIYSRLAQDFPDLPDPQVMQL